MRIKATFTNLTRALTEVTPALSDKLLMEEMKNILFWVKGGEVLVVCNNLFTTVIAKIENCTCEFAENEDANSDHYAQVKAKEFLSYLGSVSGLKMTKVDTVELDVRDAEVQLWFNESAINPEDASLAYLNKTSKFRLSKGKPEARVIKELTDAYAHMTDSATEGYITLNKTDILMTLNALVPSVSKEVRDTVNTRITFAPDYIYVIPQTYAALWSNGLPDGVSGFIVTNSVATFMQSFFALEETSKFKKIPINNDVQLLILKNSNATAVIKASTTVRAFNIAKQKVLPQDGVAIPKAYFLDVMKRIHSTNSEITFHVTVTPEGGTCKIVNKTLTQEIPVLKAKGTNDYSFSIKPDQLSSLIFSHINTGGSLLFFYMEKDETGKVTLCVSDDVVTNNNQHLWHTYCKGLALLKGDFAWT